MNIKDMQYRVVAVADDGTQFNLTDVTHGLIWSEGEKELSAKIACKLVLNDDTQYVQIGTPIIIYAGTDAFVEVIRGSVHKMTLTESNSEFYIDIETGDEAYNLRHDQEDYFFTDGHTSTAILEKILEGTPHEIRISDGTHAKKIYRQKYRSDMIADILRDLKEKTGNDYFIRAKAGVIEILPRGTNDTVYHFDIDDNIIKAKQSLDASKAVGKVKILGAEKTEGHPSVESVIEGDSSFGSRQVIYRRKNKETLSEAEAAAKKLLKENGVQFKTTLEAPDVPHLRKGDKIRIRSSVGEGFYFVKSIRHDAAQQKMTLELDALKGEYDIAETTELTDSKP